MVSYPGVNYPRYPNQFDQQKDATLPLSGSELMLVSQNGVPRNATVADILSALGRSLAASPVYASDAAAAAGGIVVGGFYLGATGLQVRVT